MKMLLSKIEVGEIYEIENGRKAIFKLQLVEDKTLYLEPDSNNIASYHNSFGASNSYHTPKDLIFGNTYFAVFHHASNRQYIAFNIKLFDNGNSIMFLHNVKKNGERHQLTYGDNTFDWNEYKTDDKHVLFEFTMK